MRCSASSTALRGRHAARHLVAVVRAREGCGAWPRTSTSVRHRPRSRRSSCSASEKRTRLISSTRTTPAAAWACSRPARRRTRWRVSRRLTSARTPTRSFRCCTSTPATRCRHAVVLAGLTGRLPPIRAADARRRSRLLRARSLAVQGLWPVLVGACASRRHRHRRDRGDARALGAAGISPSKDRDRHSASASSRTACCRPRRSRLGRCAVGRSRADRRRASASGRSPWRVKPRLKRRASRADACTARTLRAAASTRSVCTRPRATGTRGRPPISTTLQALRLILGMRAARHDAGTGNTAGALRDVASPLAPIGRAPGEAADSGTAA